MKKIVCLFRGLYNSFRHNLNLSGHEFIEYEITKTRDNEGKSWSFSKCKTCGKSDSSWSYSPID